MATPFWEGQYTEGMTNLEELGVVPTWKRDNFTTQELQIIAAKVGSCNSLDELLTLLRSDLSTANCIYKGPRQTGREVADYLEKIFAGEKMTVTELREKTDYLGFNIPGQLSLFPNTEKFTKQSPDPDKIGENDFGLLESWAIPPNASRPEGISEVAWLKMQNEITAKRPRVKTKEELEASLPKAFPMTWSAQVPTTTREPENLDHWDAWYSNQASKKGLDMSSPKEISVPSLITQKKEVSGSSTPEILITPINIETTSDTINTYMATENPKTPREQLTQSLENNTRTPKMGDLFANAGIRPENFPKQQEINVYALEKDVLKDLHEELNLTLKKISLESVARSKELKDLFDTFINKSKPGSDEKKAVLELLNNKTSATADLIGKALHLDEKIHSLDSNQSTIFPNEFYTLKDTTLGVLTALDATKNPDVRKKLAQLLNLTRRPSPKKAPEQKIVPPTNNPQESISGGLAEETLPSYLQEALIQELRVERTNAETRKKLTEYGYGQDLSPILTPRIFVAPGIPPLPPKEVMPLSNKVEKVAKEKQMENELRSIQLRQKELNWERLKDTPDVRFERSSGKIDMGKILGEDALIVTILFNDSVKGLGIRMVDTESFYAMNPNISKKIPSFLENNPKIQNQPVPVADKNNVQVFKPLNPQSFVKDEKHPDVSVSYSLNSQFPSNYSIEKITENGIDVTDTANNNTFSSLIPQIPVVTLTPTTSPVAKDQEEDPNNQPPTNISTPEKREFNPNRIQLPPDLFEALELYEDEVLHTANLIQYWMEDVRSKMIDASIDTVIERTSAIRAALARLSQKENILDLTQKIASTTLPIQIPNAAIFDKNINDFVLEIKNLKRTSPQQIKTLSLSKFIQTQGLKTISERYRPGGASTLQIRDGETQFKAIEEETLQNLKSSSTQLSALLRPTATPARDFNAEKLTINANIQAYEVAIEANKRSVESLLKTEKSITNALAAEQLLSDTDKKETLKLIQERRITLEVALKKIEGELVELKKQQAALTAQAAQQNLAAAAQAAQQPNIAPTAPNANPTISTPEILSPSEQKIKDQVSLALLCDLLISKDYKDITFGSGTRAIKGAELAKRISDKILVAPVGAQIDPYLFIPDAFIARKVQELIDTSTEWEESVSIFGTSIFEKKKIVPLSPDTQKAVDKTRADVAKAAKPGMWQRIKKWANSGIVSGKEVSETRKQLGKVGFWASLIAALGIGVAAYSQEGKAENISQAPSQPVAEASQDGGAVVAAQNTEAVNESVSTSSANQIQQVGAPQMKTIEVVDEKTGQKYTLQAPIDTVTRNTNNEVPQQTGSANTNNTLVQQSSTEQPQSNPADIAIPTDTPDEAAPQTVERPASFESVTNLKNYFAKTGKLAAFERLYGYADGQAEKTRNQLPSSRAYWFETMLLEKPKEVLRTNAGGGMTPSELQYAIKRYRQQETGFFDTQIDPIDIREIRTKQDALTAWHAKYIGPLNEELKQLGSTSKVLNNPNTTMAEYLVDVIDRAEKNGLGDKLGLSPLTSEKLQEVLNYKPEVAASDLSAAELTTADLAAPKQGELETNRSPGIENIENFSDYQVSERTQWLRDTLSGATLDGVEYGNLRDINDWLNYRLNPVIEGYWDQKRQSESLRGGVYTITDLEYMIAGFKELGTRLDRLGRRDDDGNRIPVDTDRTAQIQRILNDLEDELANKQSRSNTPGRISI